MAGTYGLGRTPVYRKLIQMGAGRMNPRYIEAWILMDHATMDYLTVGEFSDAVRRAKASVRAFGNRRNEQLAKSFGL